VKKEKNPLVNLTAMDTHKADAELSFLSSGEEVYHSLPVKADDLCFICNTNCKYPMVSSGAYFLPYLNAANQCPGEQPCRNCIKG
jgi:hypothetical protein